MEVYQSQLELIATGVCRGELEVTTEELARRAWIKYNTDGTPQGEARVTPVQEIYERFGVRKRPIASLTQTHASMFIEALDDALKNSQHQIPTIRGNVVALYAASTTKQKHIPRFLEDVCDYAGLLPGAKREFVFQACSGFNNGVNRLSAYVEEKPVEGYAIVGASEILGPLWKEDNFDRMLFGDLAGVAIFRVCPSPDLPREERRIIEGIDKLTPDSRDIVRINDIIYMDGKTVLEKATRGMHQTCIESLQKTGLSLTDINQFIFHSGSSHLIHRLGRQMRREFAKNGIELEEEKQMPHYVEDSGNNGGATTINILHRQLRARKILPSERIYMGAIGEGYYEASVIINESLMLR